MFKNPDSRLCTSTCLHYNDSYTCRVSCSDEQYYQGRLCVSSCRKDQFIEKGRQCASSCSSGYFQITNDLRVCQDNCGLYLPVDNQFQCVSECPENASYQ